MGSSWLLKKMSVWHLGWEVPWCASDKPLASEAFPDFSPESTALRRRQNKTKVKLLWFIWRLPVSLCECSPNIFGIHWPVPAILCGILKLNFIRISFIQVSSWLQERNLLSAVPEERQQVKSRSPGTSENPCWSNASNTLPLCQNSVKLQMQINKQWNLMSSLIAFSICQGSHGHSVLSSSKFSHYTDYAQCSFPCAKHYSLKRVIDIWFRKR